MSDKDNVYFVDGYSPRKGFIGIVAYLNELVQKDIEHTRFYMIKDGEWYHRELNEEIRSVIYTIEPTWWLLEKCGKIIKITQNGIEEENVKVNVEITGNLSKLKLIGSNIYCCGFRRQVYKRNNDTWLLISKDIIPKNQRTSSNFLCIDGFGEQDLYVGGTKGEFFHFDGNKWQKIHIGTNVTIESILCASNGMVYVGGKKGIIAYGKKDIWTIIEHDIEDKIFWDMANFKEKIYLSTLNNLFLLEKNKLKPLNIDSYHLSSNGDELWSIGQKTICYFDGKVWTKMKCPDS